VTDVRAITVKASDISSKVTVTFSRNPADFAFVETRVYVSGYKGNPSPVQVASGQSPVSFSLENTGEPVTVTVQASGSSGDAPISTAPTTTLQLVKTPLATTPTTAGNGTSPAPAPPYAIHSFYGANNVCPLNTTSTTLGATTTVFFLLIELSAPITIGHVTAGRNTVDQINKKGFCAGIYDLSGNKLLSGDSLSTGTQGIDSVSITPVTLPAGRYYFAWGAIWNSINPAGTGGHSFAAASSGGSGTLNRLINKNSTAYGTAANTLSGTSAAATMPATLGALTIDNTSTAVVVPCVLFEA
jgi:hypothetical protein